MRIIKRHAGGVLAAESPSRKRPTVLVQTGEKGPVDLPSRRAGDLPHADAVTVASGRSVVVFNIAGNGTA